jgi:hypothetical protein
MLLTLAYGYLSTVMINGCLKSESRSKLPQRPAPGGRLRVATSTVCCVQVSIYMNSNLGAAQSQMSVSACLFVTVTCHYRAPTLEPDVKEVQLQSMRQCCQIQQLGIHTLR